MGWDGTQDAVVAALLVAVVVAFLCIRASRIRGHR